MPRSAQSTTPPPAGEDPSSHGKEPWWLFRNDVEAFRHLTPEARRRSKCVASASDPDDWRWPEAPPWRRFQQRPGTAGQASVEGGMDDKYWRDLDAISASSLREQQRGLSFRLPRTNNQLTASAERILLAVNAAIHLRRPLLVTGLPGSGKTSLAYAIAAELGLGPVLVWSITPRSRLLEDGLYRYDALARLQQADLDRSAAAQGVAPQPPRIEAYLRLGPVGTAFLPSRVPRVLLIDEIDKADLQLPNELLHLFEEGRYEISELTRSSKVVGGTHTIRTVDAKATEENEELLEVPLDVDLRSGFVRCFEFPIVVMTSNREREFSPAFHRRCIRVGMPPPDETALTPIVEAHFDEEHLGAKPNKARLREEIQTFLHLDAAGAAGEADGPGSAPAAITDRAVDQLLNTLFLLTRNSMDGPSQFQQAELRRILYRNLSDSSDDTDAKGPGLAS